MGERANCKPTNNITINYATFYPVSDGKCYSYLGVDGNIYNGTSNKTRRKKDNYSR